MPSSSAAPAWCSHVTPLDLSQEPRRMVKPSTHNSSMMLRLATDSSSPVAVLDAMMRSVAPSTPVWFTGDPAPGRASPLISPTLTRSFDRRAVTSKVRVMLVKTEETFCLQLFPSRRWASRNLETSGRGKPRFAPPISPFKPARSCRRKLGVGQDGACAILPLCYPRAHGARPTSSRAGRDAGPRCGPRVFFLGFTSRKQEMARRNAAAGR